MSSKMYAITFDDVLVFCCGIVSVSVSRYYRQVSYRSHNYGIYRNTGAIQDARKMASVTFTCEPIGLSSLGLLRRIPVCREENTNEWQAFWTIVSKMLIECCSGSTPASLHTRNSTQWSNGSAAECKYMQDATFLTVAWTEHQLLHGWNWKTHLPASCSPSVCQSAHL